MKKKSKFRAKYKCLNKDCSITWKEDRPKQLLCPNCKHKYVKWLNYDKFEKEFNICIQ